MAKNSIGDKRGDIAHKSAGIQKSLDPRDMVKEVQFIAEKLKALDEKIVSLSPS
ncbi:MAG: hypothetical protein HQK89_04465 [Nitrospirae bacterium]|nr:hypothetical protein [Nitrospirota bacterium]